MSTYGNNPIQGNVPTSIFGKAIANQITPTDGQVVTFVAANDRWEPVAAGAGADTKVVVFENLVQIGAVARRLNYSNVDDFIITEDAGNDVFTFAINRNAADGIAGLDASSRLAKANQHSATVYNDQANSYTAGAKQSVTHDATTAGFQLVGAAGDPSALVNGDVWHNTTSNLLFARLNAASREFVFRTLAQILTGKTISASSNTITDIGASEVIADIITGQTLLAGAADPAADELLIHDNSLGALRRVVPNNLGIAGGTDEDVQVNLASVAVGVPRHLNFVNGSHFSAVEDVPGNEIDVTLDTNVANGIAALNGSNELTSNLANLNQLPALTINRALESDGSGVIIASAVTNTELNLLAGQVATLVNTATASAYAGGVKQSFLHDATTAGLRFVGAAGDPSALVNGDVWHNTTSNLLFARLNAVSREFVFRTLAQILTGKSMDANSNTFTNFGASEVIADIITGQTAITLPVQPALDTLLIHDSSASALREVFVEDLQKKLPSVLTAQGAIIPASANPTKTTVAGTNHSYVVLDYPNGSTTSAFWDFRMPSDIGTNLDLTFIITWISTVTSGDVDFEAAILGRADSEPYDAALTNATIVTLVTDAVAGDINRTTITINTSGVDEDDDIIVRIRRLGAADTMAADARFINCRMLYA